MGRPPIFFEPNCGVQGNKMFSRVPPSLSLHVCGWAPLIPLIPLLPHGLEKFLKLASILASRSLFPTSSERKVKKIVFIHLSLETMNQRMLIHFSLIYYL